MLPRRSRAGCVCALAAVFLLTACSTSPAGSTGSVRAPSAAPAPSAPVVLPAIGGTLRIAAAGPVRWVDATGRVTAAGAELARLTGRQLVSYDGVNSLGDRQDPSEDLATSPGDVSDDKLSVTFRVRDVEYAPPLSQPLRAADVVFGLQLLCDPNFRSADAGRLADAIVGYASFCAGLAAVPVGDERRVRSYIDTHPVRGITVVSDAVLRMRLTQPTGSLQNLLAQPEMTPFPESAFDPATGATSWVQAPGLGPYVRTALAHGGFGFSRNPHWDATEDPLRRAFLDHVTVTDDGSATAATAAVRAGRADLLLGAGATSSAVTETGAVVRFTTAGDLLALLPTAGTPGRCAAALANPAVRRALTIAVDRRPLATVTDGTVAQWPIPDGVLGATSSPPPGDVVGQQAGLAVATAGATPAPASRQPTAASDGSFGGAGSQGVTSAPTAGTPGGGAPVPRVTTAAGLLAAANTPGAAGDPARAAGELAAAGLDTGRPLSCSVAAAAGTGVQDPTLAGALSALPAAFRAAGIRLHPLAVGPSDLLLERLDSPWRGDSAGELLAPVLDGATDPVLLAATRRAEAESDQNLASQRWALVAEILVEDGALVPLTSDQVVSVSSTRVRSFHWLNQAEDADLANLSLQPQPG